MALDIALIRRGSAANDGTGDSARDGALKLNKNTRLLEALAKGSVISATTTAQPASPSVGDLYIIPSGKTGAVWSTYANGSLALYCESDGANAWFEITPQEGQRLLARDGDTLYRYTGSAWTDDFGPVAKAKATGSTTARSLADRAADEFNVLDYGAVPDCTSASVGTAAQSAIEACINAALSRGGGKVIIQGDSRGNAFRVTDSIYPDLLDAHLTIEFRGGAKIVAGTGLASPVLKLWASASDESTWKDYDLHIINPNIDCSAGSTPGAGSYCSGISLNYLRLVTIDNPQLYGGTDPDNANADSGIDSVSCKAVVINGGLIEGFGDAGFYPNGDNTVGIGNDDGLAAILNNVTFRRCQVAVTAKRELRLLQVNGGSVHECVAGITSAYVDPTYVGPARRMEINGVHFNKVTANMVRFTGPTIGSVRGCTFEDWGYDYDGTNSAGANAFAVSFQGTRDVDFSDNRFLLTDWTRDDQRAYSFANITLDSVLFTHGNCRFANNSYRGLARITVWTDTGDAHHFTDEYLEDISGTKFDNGTENTATTIEYEEYGQVGRRVWKNSTTYAFTDQALQLCDDASFQAMCATLGTWRIHARSGVAVPRSSVNGAGDATETAHATIALPAGALGANGIYRVTALWSCTNSANVKTVYGRLGGVGGSLFFHVATTSNAQLHIQRTVFNRNSESSQVGMQSGNGNSFTLNTGSPTTAAVNTANAQDIVLTSAWAGATSGETITLEGYLVEIAYGA